MRPNDLVHRPVRAYFRASWPPPCQTVLRAERKWCRRANRAGYGSKNTLPFESSHARTLGGRSMAASGNCGSNTCRAPPRPKITSCAGGPCFLVTPPRLEDQCAQRSEFFREHSLLPFRNGPSFLRPSICSSVSQAPRPRGQRAEATRPKPK